METKKDISTVGSIYNGFTDIEKSIIQFIVGCSIEKTENENEYEEFKTNTLHVNKLSNAIYLMSCGTTIGSVFRSFTIEQKMIVGLLIGYAMIKNENEKENAKQNIAYMNKLNYERVQVGLSFLFSEDFYK